PHPAAVDGTGLVLLVDDDPGTRDTLVDILTLAGLPARAVATASEAFAAQTAAPAAVAVAVVDYRLPDGTGLEVAARLKTADADLPVIVLTGNATLETAVAAVGQVDEYLTKPVIPHTLLRAVRAALERRRLLGENRDLLQRLHDANCTLEARVRDRTEELRAEGERLTEAQRIARIGSWEWDFTRGALTCSAELLRLYGLPADHHLASYDELLSHLPADDRAAVAAAARQAIDSHEPFLIEVRVTAAGEEPRWLQVQGRVHVAADGRPLRMTGTSQDVTGRKQAERTLAHQALHDTLTGLPNRALLDDRLDQALLGAARTGRPVAVLFLDVDRFKLVNDSWGHPAGDQLLVGVAQRLGRTVRPGDTVARFGGDEFVVVCAEGGTMAGAIQVAERISAALRAPFRIAGQDIFLTVSIGIAIGGAEPSAEALLRDADAAMYRAKDQGRARVEFFDDTMRVEAAARLELQTGLQWALQRHELRVFYQPLVEVASGRVVGVEALVRWDHPQRGLLHPSSFIPLAEESDLIIPIGDAVLHQVAADHARWQAIDPQAALWSWSVNLSARHLRHPGLANYLRQVLDEHALEPSRLCLELTESVLMEDLGRHTETLHALRHLGIRLALDDFGTGYSSLTYLKHFPVDILKIDQSFVAGLGTDHPDTAIVRNVIELAHALDLIVVAEGVETPQQLDQLRGLGLRPSPGLPPRP
ncbi:MAG TPA: EAL domain-containing protein, partial [Acidimicrobiia bacterium]|nr:EAL domain-containing protein [Acidimicrobiia bacterium]